MSTTEIRYGVGGFPQWHADWWCTCVNCHNQEYIDGNTAKQRYKNMRKDGWRYVKGRGWVCPKCDPMGW